MSASRRPPRRIPRRILLTPKCAGRVTIAVPSSTVTGSGGSTIRHIGDVGSCGQEANNDDELFTVGPAESSDARSATGVASVGPQPQPQPQSQRRETVVAGARRGVAAGPWPGWLRSIPVAVSGSCSARYSCSNKFSISRSEVEAVVVVHRCIHNMWIHCECGLT